MIQWNLCNRGYPGTNKSVRCPGPKLFIKGLHWVSVWIMRVGSLLSRVHIIRFHCTQDLDPHICNVSDDNRVY